MSALTRHPCRRRGIDTISTHRVPDDIGLIVFDETHGVKAEYMEYHAGDERADTLGEVRHG